jgi:hypothetical protein
LQRSDKGLFTGLALRTTDYLLLSLIFSKNRSHFFGVLL